MTKPKCVACSKPLRKRTHSKEIKIGDPHPTEMYGRKVIQVVRIKVFTWKPGYGSVSVWTGEWGGYGDGRFCGLTCGYDWAMRRLGRVYTEA